MDAKKKAKKVAKKGVTKARAAAIKHDRETKREIAAKAKLLQEMAKVTNECYAEEEKVPRGLLAILKSFFFKAK